MHKSQFYCVSILKENIENRRMGTGRGEKIVSCMERVTWKLILSYVKYIANGGRIKEIQF